MVRHAMGGTERRTAAGHLASGARHSGSPLNQAAVAMPSHSGVATLVSVSVQQRAPPSPLLPLLPLPPLRRACLTARASEGPGASPGTGGSGLCPHRRLRNASGPGQREEAERRLEAARVPPRDASLPRVSRYLCHCLNFLGAEIPATRWLCHLSSSPGTAIGATP